MARFTNIPFRQQDIVITMHDKNSGTVLTVEALSHDFVSLTVDREGLYSLQEHVNAPERFYEFHAGISVVVQVCGLLGALCEVIGHESLITVRRQEARKHAAERARVYRMAASSFEAAPQ